MSRCSGPPARAPPEVIDSAACASATASSPPRSRRSSPCAATRPTGSPGAKGIGEKGGAQLLRDHGDLEALIALAADPAAVTRKLLRPKVAETLRVQADELRAFQDMATLRHLDVERPADAPTRPPTPRRSGPREGHAPPGRAAAAAAARGRPAAPVARGSRHHGGASCLCQVRSLPLAAMLVVARRPRRGAPAQAQAPVPAAVPLASGWQFRPDGPTGASRRLGSEERRRADGRAPRSRTSSTRRPRSASSAARSAGTAALHAPAAATASTGRSASSRSAARARRLAERPRDRPPRRPLRPVLAARPWPAAGAAQRARRPRRQPQGEGAARGLVELGRHRPAGLAGAARPAPRSHDPGLCPRSTCRPGGEGCRAEVLVRGTVENRSRRADRRRPGSRCGSRRPAAASPSSRPSASAADARREHPRLLHRCRSRAAALVARRPDLYGATHHHPRRRGARPGRPPAHRAARGAGPQRPARAERAPARRPRRLDPGGSRRARARPAATRTSSRSSTT